MSTTAAIGGGVSTFLIIIASADLAFGTGKLGTFILVGMVIGAACTAAAASLAESIAEAIPTASAFSGTIAAMAYLILRVMIWVDQHAGA